MTAVLIVLGIVGVVVVYLMNREEPEGFKAVAYPLLVIAFVALVLWFWKHHPNQEMLP